MILLPFSTLTSSSIYLHTKRKNVSAAFAAEPEINENKYFL